MDVVKSILSIILLFYALIGSTQSTDLQWPTPQDTAELNAYMHSIFVQLDSSQTVDFEKVRLIQKSALTLRDTASFFYLSKFVCRYYYASNGLYEDGVIFLKESQNLLNTEKSHIDDFNNITAIFYKRMNFYTEALEYYYKSVSWFEEYEPENTTIPLGNLAEIYFENKNYEKALYYNELALKSSLKLENVDDRLSNVTYDFFRIGLIQHALGENKIANSYFQKSLDAARTYDKESPLLLLTIAKALYFYNNIEDNQQAKSLIEEGEKLINRAELCPSEECIRFELEKNKYFINTGDIAIATVPEQIDTTDNSLQKELLDYGISYYSQALDFDKSSLYYDKLIKLEASISIENRKISYSNIEEKYKNKKLEKRNQELAEDISRRKKITTIIGALLLAILSLLVLQLLNNNRYKKLNNVLQRKSDDLATANVALANKNEELERFTFIASHDLKTPLRTIISFTDLLKMKLANSDDKSIHEYLTFIKEGGTRLDNLISATLEYSKVSSKTYNYTLEQVDLNKALSHIETSMKDSLEERNAEIVRPKNLPVINSHYDSLVNIFRNLIENGIKYNKESRPEITFSLEEDEQFYSIFVSDNGIGIAEEYHEKVFNMFFRLHRQEEHKGSGLGLAISKKIINQLGGNILLHKTNTKGSLFEVKLPKS